MKGNFSQEQLMVRNYRACRARQKAAMGRFIKLMCTWTKNDEGGFETRPCVFSALGRENAAPPPFHIYVVDSEKKGPVP